jgi:hypothetical protein
MASLQPTPTTLRVTFTLAEKLAGLVRDAEFPRAAVAGVEVLPDPVSELRGLRAPGLAIPGVRKIGTWRRPGQRTLVSVRSGQPALRVRLTGQRYDTLVIGSDDAAALAAALTGAR